MFAQTHAKRKTVSAQALSCAINCLQYSVLPSIRIGRILQSDMGYWNWCFICLVLFSMLLLLLLQSDDTGKCSAVMRAHLAMTCDRVFFSVPRRQVDRRWPDGRLEHTTRTSAVPDSVLPQNGAIQRTLWRLTDHTPVTTGTADYWPLVSR